MAFSATKTGLMTILMVAILLTGAYAVAMKRVPPYQIAILVSHEGAAFRQALDSFSQHLQSAVEDVVLEVHFLDGEPEKATDAVSRVVEDGPDLVFTLGSLALESVADRIGDTPIVAGIVFQQSRYASYPNVSGVHLDISLDDQFLWLRRFFPDAVRVGVLYNPEENSGLIKDASQVAKRHGFELESVAVNSPRDIPVALKALVNNDVIWSIKDDMIMNSQTAKHILLFSFRNRVPLVGLSQAWVKAGALFALDRDFDDIGRQCGQVAVEILKGGGQKIPRLVPPRKTVYSLNSKTAQRMKIELPGKIIDNAVQVY